MFLSVSMQKQIAKAALVRRAWSDAWSVTLYVMVLSTNPLPCADKYDVMHRQTTLIHMVVCTAIQHKTVILLQLHMISGLAVVGAQATGWSAQQQLMSCCMSKELTSI